MERLHRQLMEFEVMEAMYPGDADATTGSFVVLNPEGVDAVRALVDAWEASGKEPASKPSRRSPPFAHRSRSPSPTARRVLTVTLRVSLPASTPARPRARGERVALAPRRRDGDGGHPGAFRRDPDFRFG